MTYILYPVHPFFCVMSIYLCPYVYDATWYEQNEVLLNGRIRFSCTDRVYCCTKLKRNINLVRTASWLCDLCTAVVPPTLRQAIALLIPLVCARTHVPTARSGAETFQVGAPAVPHAESQQISFQKTENKTGYPFVVFKPTQGSGFSFCSTEAEKTCFSHIALHHCRNYSPHRTRVTTKRREHPVIYQVFAIQKGHFRSEKKTSRNPRQYLDAQTTYGPQTWQRGLLV